MTANQLLTDSFTTKQGYLAWRAAWRAAYAQISADIRLKVLLHKDHCRNPAVSYVQGTAGTPGHWVRARAWTPEEAKRQELQAAWTERSVKCVGDSPAFTLSALASLLMLRRKWSKEEAQRQWLAQHKPTQEVLP